MDLIVETDLGRDPDDLFALLYLVSAGVTIRCITISPGDRDQVAVARWLCHELGLDIPIGVGKPFRDKTSSGGVHYKMLKRYGRPLQAAPDGPGGDIIARVMDAHPDSELFAIGPLMSVGAYLSAGSGRRFARSTMQGGFVGYDLHGSAVERLAKFEGILTCPTFNMNGDIRGVEALLGSPTPRNFVGKNVCHTVVYDRRVYAEFITRTEPLRSRALELFAEVMGAYLDGHDGKKFHDPTAAVCHLHPTVGTWFGGTLYRSGGGWGTRVGGSDCMLIDIDRARLWGHLWRGD